MSSAGSNELKRPGTTANHAFERLVQGILRGEFVGGRPLREARLAREWDISRTPLREALRRAAEAGFVVLRPNQAPIVRELAEPDIDAMYDLRALLETHALRLAWDRIDTPLLERLAEQAAAAAPGAGKRWQQRCLAFDRALHRAWTRRCGNAWLQADLKRQHQFWGIFQNWVGREEQALRKAYAEHIEILDAMRAGEQAQAARALRRHIRTSATGVKKVLPAGQQE